MRRCTEYRQAGLPMREVWARSCWRAALALYRSQNRVADVEKALRELDLLADR
ncbi:hypothetical protein AB0A63_25915 [Lentzea sp. NPDC042327]|uniref:hypothetical protein n=1 Tax=Lentzea sp. NPDC042327 TaxID=3154801 RepID=UPI0033F4D4BC